MELFSVVAVLNDMPAQGLVRGQMGTMVELLGPTVGMVEFSDDDGKTYALETIPLSDLMLLHHQPMEQVA